MRVYNVGTIGGLAAEVRKTWPRAGWNVEIGNYSGNIPTSTVYFRPEPTRSPPPALAEDFDEVEPGSASRTPAP